MEQKYPVYFCGSSHPYHKQLTLKQAEKEALTVMRDDLRIAGFRAFAYVMDSSITGTYGIAINYGLP